MVRACIKKEWWACFEKCIVVWSEGQKEARTTKEDVEDASGEREQECLCGEGGWLELSKMESVSWRNCCYSGFNPTTPVYGDKPELKLDWLI